MAFGSSTHPAPSARSRSCWRRPVEPGPKLTDEGSRERCTAIAGTLAVAHENFPPFEVHILDAQLKSLQQPKTRSVQQTGYERRRTTQFRKQTGNLARSEDDGT